MLPRSRPRNSVRGAFPANASRFDPVFPHLHCQKAFPQIPKTLTSHQNAPAPEKSRRLRTQVPNLLTYGPPRSRSPSQSRAECWVERSRCIPESLTFLARMPIFRQKYRSAPRKFSPSVRVFSCLGSPMAFTASKPARKFASQTVPKALTSGSPRLRTDFHVLSAIRSHELLQNLTFGQTVCWRGILNPLTLRPAAAHRGPRTSSLQRPARAHHLSRKASPSRPETPAT
jgi:hypothetical protein